MVILAGKLYTCVTISYKRPWKAMSKFCFYKHPETMEKEKKVTARKFVTKKDLGANGLHQFLSSLLFDLWRRIRRCANPFLCWLSSS